MHSIYKWLFEMLNLNPPVVLVSNQNLKKKMIIEFIQKILTQESMETKASNDRRIGLDIIGFNL